VFVFSPGDERTAWILVDCPAAIGIQAVVDANGGADAATTCDVFMQELGEGEAALPFELINVINTKVDTVDTVVDALTTNLATVAGYTIKDGWRVLYKVITANPGTTPGTKLFTVATGVAEVQIFAYCEEDIAGTGDETLTVMAPGGAVTLIAATPATSLDAGEIWHDNDPADTVELSSVAPSWLVYSDGGVNTRSITLVQSGAAEWTGGTLEIICRWRPVTVTVAAVT